jgi:hypothetical protein
MFSPAGPEDLDELPPASAKDAKEAMKPLSPATLVQCIRLREGWLRGYRNQRSIDPAAGIGGQARLICHAAATPKAILPLAVAVIQPRFPALLIAPVGLSQLFPPALLTAGLTAVGLSAITGKAEEKHRATARSAAKQLSQYHPSRHRLPGRSGQWRPVVPRWTWLLWFLLPLLARGTIETQTPIVAATGVSTLLPRRSNLPKSLRYATAMMLIINSSIAASA